MELAAGARDRRAGRHGGRRSSRSASRGSAAAPSREAQGPAEHAASEARGAGQGGATVGEPGSWRRRAGERCGGAITCRRDHAEGWRTRAIGKDADRFLWDAEWESEARTLANLLGASFTDFFLFLSIYGNLYNLLEML